jgi:hypothetical protein
MILKSCNVALAAVSAFVLITPMAAFAADSSAKRGVEVAVYADGRSAPAAGYKTLGRVSEQICRKPWEMAPTQADVLDALKAKASAMGANGLVAVRFDDHRLAVKTPCWQRMAVSGDAIVTGSSIATN